MIGRLGGAAALALGAVGLGPAAGQVVESQAAPTADPSRTRSEEPAPDSGLGERTEPPALDTAVPPEPRQTPAAPDAPAATAANDGRLVYDAAFFAAFSPANALQIVERVPGFTLEAVSEEVRGFGVSASNVVINGQRPSIKSDSLQAVLRRIPASRVQRVEVGRGDLFGAEYAGKPQVVNLVLASAGGLAGTVEGTLYRSYTGKLFPEGTASALLRRGPSTFNLSVGVVNDETPDEGYDRLVSTSDGSLVEFREKFNDFAFPRGYVSGSWEINKGENRTGHINFRLGRDRTILDQSSIVTSPDGTVREEPLFQRYRVHAQELGGDYTVPFAGGGLKLIGLATRRQRFDRDGFFQREGGETVGGFRQTRDDERAETLVRVVWNRSALGPWSVEAGVEGVVNELESRVDLFALGPDGASARVDLPIDDATVKENRGEVFVNAGRPLSTALRLDFGATFEASELTVTGDAEAERVLRFVKPRATLDWRSEKGWHAQASVKRTVAQLQFEDFISVAELANERINGGNAQLVPQRAWEFLIFLEKPVLGDGLVRLETGYNRISLLQDRVPTPEGFDAPGNLGDAELFLARGRADAPLDVLGIKGGRATLSLSYVDTSVRDPYTLEPRPFSGNSAFAAEFSFRQDLRKFAWGFTLDGSTPFTFYRLDELDRNRGGVPYVRAFAEYRPSQRTTVTFGLDNAAATPSYRRRTFFFPDRRTREADLIEYRKRDRYVIPYLTLKHSFG